ncbi:PAS/PAC domain [uncultured Alphaproteobacteria bacterium]|uniref:PAS/PAC domain n=1 Tax=uncultured Alphaproteobacteria bacterium TaxID=91750 RepID=A0A212KM45_9PROT|nr:PAS/PAC domain [uncultured Alphaproteobacteria bacterium]
MSRPKVTPTGVERTWPETDLIVSKTDPRGVITYANETFCRVAQYTDVELVGRSQNIVRHPDMPRCIFQLLWETIAAGEEMFAYIVNLAKSGDHYWVFAHVTPSFDAAGRIVGYHSSRRAPRRDAVDKAAALYRELRAAEASRPDPKSGMAAGRAMLDAHLKTAGVAYDEYIFLF